MTTPLQVPYIAYTGNGLSTTFTYPFYLLDATHLQVFLNGALTGGYTVLGVGNVNGGVIQMAVAPLIGASLILRRQVPADQLVDYRPYDPFPAETHERALDKLTMLAQGAALVDGNSVRAPVLEPPGATNLVLPAASVRANFLLGFDNSGNVLLYANPGPPGVGVTAHGMLTGLGNNDHPQYLLSVNADANFLRLTGGTLSGNLFIPAGFPTLPTQAVNKQYVDTFTGSVITKNVISTALGDAQPTVQAAWNAQANTDLITRASNEILYYRWPAAGTIVYRYVGTQQGPAGWVTVAADWVAASGVNEAPLDGFIYGRVGAAWAQVVPRAGGSYLGKVQGFAGLAAAADLSRTDEVKALDAALMAAHTALVDPHPQYLLKADDVGVFVQDAQPAGLKQGQQWWESDSGAFIMRYINPDLTETFVGIAQASGDFVPMAMRGATNGVASLDATTKVPIAQLPNFALLGNFADDAAAAVGGVAIGSMYRTVSTLKVRVA